MGKGPKRAQHSLRQSGLQRTYRRPTASYCDRGLKTGMPCKANLDRTGDVLFESLHSPMRISSLGRMHVRLRPFAGIGNSPGCNIKFLANASGRVSSWNV